VPSALLVEDSRTIRLVLREAMSELGFDVEEADDGDVAIERLARSDARFDVVLLDWRLTRVDGLAVLDAIRRDPRTTSLPVLMITGERDRRRVDEALAAGVSELLTKPVSSDDLATVLGRLGLLERS
jgi:two-component system, chemotaxis family, chemotaxis protein CheY